MRFHSTSGVSPAVSFRDAVFHGLAPDGGLYMPVEIPRLPVRFFDTLPDLTLPEVAADVLGPFVADEIPKRELGPMLDQAFDFPAPLVPLGDDDHVLELFHGPTLAFKDFGARFLARALAWFHRGAARPLTVLVATSGDTGSAVAHGFIGVAGVRVVVLYPSGKVSRIQEQQMTTLGGNVTAAEVAGTFDDCQRLVKQAFADSELRERLPLTSANSINIGRLLPQAIYYVHAYRQLAGAARSPVVFSVPSGNFGNLSAGLLASRMGLPVECLIAATNLNDVVPAYLETFAFRPRPSVQTLTNAMDVGNPSNFVRLQSLIGEEPGDWRRTMFGVSFNDAETLDGMGRAYRAHGYVFDPHGAVAWLGLRRWRETRGGQGPGVALATAHPAKFDETVERATAAPVEMPARLKAGLDRPKQSTPIAADYEALRAILTA